MNYQEMQQLFRREKLALQSNLQLNYDAVDWRRLKKDWKAVKSVNNVHKFGGLFGMIYVGIALTLAYFNWSELQVSIPLLLGAVALLLNGYFFPVMTLPTTDLERYTATDLANQLREFNAYANRRFPFDAIAASAFLFALVNWALRYFYGINLFLPINDDIALGIYTKVGVLLFVPMLLAYLGNRKSVRQLAQLEEELRGYQEDELV